MGFRSRFRELDQRPAYIYYSSSWYTKRKFPEPPIHDLILRLNITLFNIAYSFLEITYRWPSRSYFQNQNSARYYNSGFPIPGWCHGRHEPRNCERISVSAASKYLSNLVYSYKRMGLSMVSDEIFSITLFLIYWSRAWWSANGTRRSVSIIRWLRWYSPQRRSFLRWFRKHLCLRCAWSRLSLGFDGWRSARIRQNEEPSAEHVV